MLSILVPLWDSTHCVQLLLELEVAIRSLCNCSGLKWSKWLLQVLMHSLHMSTTMCLIIAASFLLLWAARRIYLCDMSGIGQYYFLINKAFVPLGSQCVYSCLQQSLLAACTLGLHLHSRAIRDLKWIICLVSSLRCILNWIVCLIVFLHYQMDYE